MSLQILAKGARFCIFNLPLPFFFFFKDSGNFLLLGYLVGLAFAIRIHTLSNIVFCSITDFSYFSYAKGRIIAAKKGTCFAIKPVTISEANIYLVIFFTFTSLYYTNPAA